MHSFAMLRCSLFRFRARTPSSLPNGCCLYSCRPFASSACVNRVYRVWSLEEDQMILSLRQKGLRTHDIALQIPDRSLTQVRQRVAKLGHESIKPPQKTLWNPREDAILLEKYHAGLNNEQIMPYLPGRTARAIQSRLLAHVPTKKERKTWTPAERQRVVDSVKIDGLSIRATAEALGRSYHSVEGVFHRFGRLGQPVDSPQKRWTPTEKQRVVDLRINSGLSLEEIAEQLGRSVYSVCFVWAKYGKRTLTTALYQSPRPQTAWTPEEDALLVALHEKGLTVKEISQHIPGRSFSAVQTQLYVRQLKKIRKRSQRPMKLEMDAMRTMLIPVLDGSTTYDEAVSKLEPGLQRMASTAFRKMKKERSEHGSPPSAGSLT